MARLGTLTFPNLALLLVLLIAAAVIMYALVALLMATAFWLVGEERNGAVQRHDQTGRFPVSAYPPWLRGVLTVVVPVAFMTRCRRPPRSAGPTGRW